MFLHIMWYVKTWRSLMPKKIHLKISQDVILKNIFDKKNVIMY
jgi:hypothetical protein